MDLVLLKPELENGLKFREPRMNVKMQLNPSL